MEKSVKDGKFCKEYLTNNGMHKGVIEYSNDNPLSKKHSIINYDKNGKVNRVIRDIDENTKQKIDIINGKIESRTISEYNSNKGLVKNTIYDGNNNVVKTVKYDGLKYAASEPQKNGLIRETYGNWSNLHSENPPKTIKYVNKEGKTIRSFDISETKTTKSILYKEPNSEDFCITMPKSGTYENPRIQIGKDNYVEFGLPYVDFHEITSSKGNLVSIKNIGKSVLEASSEEGIKFDYKEAYRYLNKIN